MFISYVRLVFFTGLTIINFISAIAYSEGVVELRFKFNGEQTELFKVDEDIIKSLKAMGNLRRYREGMEFVIPDGVGASVVHNIIRVLSKAKSWLHVDEERKRETILETYSLSQATPEELQNSVEKSLSFMSLSSDELLDMMVVADYLDVAAIFKASVNLWAKHHSSALSRFNSLNMYFQEAIIKKLKPQEFLTLMQVNESNTQEDPETLFAMALMAHYQEKPPEGVTAKAHYERPRIGANFVLIPGGEYQIGSQEAEANRYSNEDLHPISLSPFFIMDAAVTQEFYAMKMGNNPSLFKEEKYCPESFKEIEANDVKISVLFGHPVEMVSYNDAIAFAEHLSNEDPLYNYSLPTEAQLEVVFRGGTTTAYVSGDDPAGLNEYVWHSGNSGNQTHPVKSNLANALGIHRSSVWEWAKDWYDHDYSGSAGLDPKGPVRGLFRVIRGGSWRSSAQDCRSAYRYAHGPVYRSSSLGFRLVITRK